MREFKKIICLVYFVVFLPIVLSAFDLTVICTNDLHSSFEGSGPDRYFTPTAGDSDPIKGHYARIAAAISKIRHEKSKENEPVLLLDGGDYSVGTLFHTVAPSEKSEMIPEYNFFSDLKYDAVTIGNHDFEPFEKGLAIALSKAEKLGLKIPLVTTNLHFNQVQESLLKKYYSDSNVVSKTAFHRCILKEYSSGDKKIKVGFVGLVGPDGSKLCLSNRHECSFYGFNDSTGKEDIDLLCDKLKSVVLELKNKYKADIVIALMHGGPDENKTIADKIPEINLIIAGHTHQKIFFREKDTLIIQTGAMGENIGVMELTLQNGSLTLRNEDRIFLPMDDSVESDDSVLKDIETYKDEICKVIPDSKFHYDSIIFDLYNSFPRGRFPENFAGTIVASKILKRLNEISKKNFDFYLTSFGMIRSQFILPKGFPKVSIQYSDIFKFSSLGYDNEMVPGAEIVQYYLTKNDFSKLLEAMFAFSSKTPSYEPVVSDSVTFKKNFFGIPMINKIGDLRLNGKEFKDWPDLLFVASNDFFARNLLKIKTITKGIVSISPRDEKGKEITSFEKTGFPREHEILAESLAERVERE
ncbi:MAG: metallophosphoesterase [Candidatus Riflebacteria bacterium]|nr:metallophosphoesterase [Candidatus Riflebacteria bacterium]